MEKSIKKGGAIERLRQFVDSQDFSRYKFYKTTGLSNGFLDGNKNIGSDKCEIISFYYPMLSIEWLVLGIGNMLKQETKTDDNKEERVEKSQLQSSNTNIIELQPHSNANTFLSDVQASAGFGAYLENPKKLEELPATYIPDAPYGLNVAFQIKGDSMHPTIRNYDYVAANQITDYNGIREGEVYVVIDKNNEVFCKRLYKEHNAISLYSDNRTYTPFKVHHNEIAGLFRAFFRFSTDFRNYHDPMRNSIEDLHTTTNNLQKQIDEMKAGLSEDIVKALQHLNNKKKTS